MLVTQIFQRLSLLAMATLISFSLSANQLNSQVNQIKNFQVNTPHMVSSGLPSASQFKALQSFGVNIVVDLIPGDRDDEARSLKKMQLEYHNIPVEWTQPTLQNFIDYVDIMALVNKQDEKVLTHCKLNWRGAVFTYLYRVTQLGESEAVAKQDMLAIWQPNETWRRFIMTVKSHYNVAD